MSSPNKERGNRLERQLVIKAKTLNIPAVRAWGSNGRALGHHEEVDVLLNNVIKVQCKSRLRIAEHIIPNNNVDIQVIKGKGQGIFAVLPIDLYLKLIKEANEKAL